MGRKLYFFFRISSDLSFGVRSCLLLFCALRCMGMCSLLPLLVVVLTREVCIAIRWWCNTAQ
jgi:hypothetical protein